MTGGRGVKVSTAPRQQPTARLHSHPFLAGTGCTSVLTTKRPASLHPPPSPGLTDLLGTRARVARQAGFCPGFQGSRPY